MIWSKSLFINRVISISASGGRVWRSPARALAEALKGPGLFHPKRFSWSLLSDLLDERPVGALEAWLFYTKQPYPQTEVIFFKQVG